MTNHDEPDLPGLEEDFARGQEHLVVLLATTLAFQRDSILRAAIGGDGRPIAVSLGDSGPYVLLSEHKVTGSALAGEPPPGVEIVELTSAPSSTLEVLRSRLRTTRVEADHLVLAMRDDADGFRQEAFLKLQRWAPALAIDAYRQTALLQSMFDLVRVRLVRSQVTTEMRWYWDHVHMLGHLTMVSGAAEPTEWLTELANSFTWRVWTPSFPLVRERISRLAVRGAWASARFGVSTVDRYLANLADRQLLKVFDAVLALVSIATAAEPDRSSISRELFGRLEAREHASTDDTERRAIGAMLRSAQLSLTRPSDALAIVLDGHVRSRSDDRLSAVARAMDRDDDPADVDRDGYFRSILAMSQLAIAPPAVFFPATIHEVRRWRPIRSLEALSRTSEVLQSEAEPARNRLTN